MRFNMVYRRNKTLSNTEMSIVLFLAALLGVSSSNNITWFSSNMTVTRSLLSSDYFDIWNSEGTKECTLSIRPNVCQSYGAVEGKSDCKKSCCKRCMCEKHRPTFVIEKQQCVEDRNITQLSGSEQFVFVTRPNTSCANKSVIPTLDLNTPGNRTFLVCMNGVEKPREEVTSCKLISGQRYLVDSWNRLVGSPIDVKNNFKISKKLEFKWTGAGMTSLEASIVSIAAKCVTEKYTGMFLQEVNVYSSLYFKSAGSHTSSGPRVFYQFKPTQQRATKVSTIFTIPTTAVLTEYRSKLNIVQVSGEVDMLLVIIAAILGSLLLLVIGAAIIFIIILRRRQKLIISGGKHSSNPTYERGPDQLLMQNGDQTSSFKSHFYQPLVENTRVSSRKEPIYESLDDHSKVTEDPSRCSLAYCDVTADGYLIPTDGPTPLPCPINTEPRPITDNTTRPRLSSSYDEPEVILKDRKPKLKVDLGTDEKAKPYYHELEKNTEGKREHGNETVGDNCKSPTENTYLELFGEAKTPLESEML